MSIIEAELRKTRPDLFTTEPGEAPLPEGMRRAAWGEGTWNDGVEFVAAETPLPAEEKAEA